MITFSKLGQYGRLGNQLFQYAILLSVGNKNNYEIKIPNIENKIHHNQRCLLNNFNITAKTLNYNDIIKYNYNEKKLDFDSSVFDIPDNCDINGYFGHYDYLREYENEIIKELTPKKEIIEYNKKRILKIKEKYSDYIIVSLHIRRGDIIKNMDYNESYFTYLLKAKEKFKNKKCKFLVFTGGSHDNNTDSDYKWCKGLKELDIVVDENVHIMMII